MTIGHLDPVNLLAAENMAADSWMLDRSDPELTLLFRSYGWVGDAFTFGYTQKISEVQSYLESIGVSGSQVCRRPTAGGIVDHRKDWTYAIACNGQHEWSKLPPLEIYRKVHEVLVEALRLAGGIVDLYIPSTHEASPQACFDRPSPFDILHVQTGVKVAGAALKRNRSGILIQGSLSRERLMEVDFSLMDGLLLKQIAMAVHGMTDLQGVEKLTLPDPIPAFQIFASSEWLSKR